MTKQVKICFFMILFFPLGASSADYCEDAPDIIASTDVNIIGSRLSNGDMKIFHLTIGKNRLVDVEKFFGEINVFRKSPGCASCGVEACYSSIDKGVSLIFHRYTAWDFHGFTVKSNKDNPGDHCLINKLITKDISTGSGIKLGQEKEEILKVFGEPSSIKGNTYEYSYGETRKWSVKNIKSSMDAYYKQWGKAQDCDFYYYDAYGGIKFIFNKSDELIEYNVDFMESM